MCAPDDRTWCSNCNSRLKINNKKHIILGDVASFAKLGFSIQILAGYLKNR